MFKYQIFKISPKQNLLFHTDLDLSIGVIQRMKPALHQKSPLDAERRDQEVESHGTETIALQEGHEEAKANEDHDMNILKTCRLNLQNRSNMSKVLNGDYICVLVSVFLKHRFCFDIKEEWRDFKDPLDMCHQEDNWVTIVTCNGSLTPLQLSFST